MEQLIFVAKLDFFCISGYFIKVDIFAKVYIFANVDMFAKDFKQDS
jgi:hypothetical protein